MKRFTGVYANLPTPFNDTGDKLDIGRLYDLLDFVIDRGVHGVACSLSSGEYPYLTSAERRHLAQEVVRRISKRVPVFVGISALTTMDAEALAKHAQDIGADAIMVMPIQYWPLKSHEVIEHFRAISRATSLPIGIYDNPRLGAAPFTVDMYRVLKDEANAQLSKDSSADIMRVADVVRVCGPSFSVLHGNHMEMLPAYFLGAAGVCTAMASVFPELCIELFELTVVQQNWAKARQRFSELEPLFRFFQDRSLARCTKEASELMGRPLGPQRRPLSGLNQEDRSALIRLLRTYDYSPMSAH